MTTTSRITTLMTNAEFDSWADIYALARIGESTNIPFSQFLKSPWAYLASAGQEFAHECLEDGFLPLLPAQAKAALRIHSDWSEASERGGRSKSHLVLVASN